MQPQASNRACTRARRPRLTHRPVLSPSAASLANQPSLLDPDVSDDPFNPPTPPPARYTIVLSLEPHYVTFGCTDCAFPTPPPGSFVANADGPPPPPVDRYGSTLTGDCEACGMRLRGTAERVIDASGQVLAPAPRRTRPPPLATRGLRPSSRVSHAPSRVTPAV